MADVENVVPDLLTQILDEFGSRISIDGGSKVLVSDVNIANAIHQRTESVRTPYGPYITVAARGQPGEDSSQLPPNVNLKPVDSLEFDHYSHAFFGITSEDPKFIFSGLKAMITAMAPKGVAVVIALKQESKQVEGEEGQFQMALEDKLTYQSKGKIQKLSDVLEYAGFERGKIRAFEKSSEVDGKKVDADVVLAMKWDQLTG